MTNEAIRTGDWVEFTLPVFAGGSFYRGRPTGKRRFVGNEDFEGVVYRHSYGSDRGQHTFTILLPNVTLHHAWPNSPDRR